jgi:N-acetylneuraminic acid mutarotase
MNMKNFLSPIIFSVCILLIFSSMVFLFCVPNLSFATQNQSSTGIWMEGEAMPNARTEVTAANLDGQVYVIGGFTSDGKITDIVEMYNSTDNTWTQNIKSLPLPLHHASADIYGGQIYVIGGYTGDWIPSNNLFVYDPDTNNWTLGTPMPTPRGSPNTNFVNGILYVIGGDSYDHSHVVVEGYDPDTNEWMTLSSMPTARHHAASAVVDGNIYVMGGRLSSTLVNVDLIEKYNPVLDQWITDLEPMPSKRSGIGAAAVNGLIYVLGGEQNQGTFDNNERYDPASDTWSKELPMPTARHGLGVASYDDKIFAIGGGPHTGLTVSDQNEIYYLNRD